MCNCGSVRMRPPWPALVRPYLLTLPHCKAEESNPSLRTSLRNDAAPACCRSHASTHSRVAVMWQKSHNTWVVHGSTCSRVRVLNQQWRPVEDPSSEVSHDNGPLRSSRPEEIRLVREQRLLSKQNMNHPTWEWSHSRCSEHTARQNACSGQSTFTGLRGHKLHKIFCATLRMAKKCRAR